MTPEDCFWAKVDVGHPLGCWQWTAARSSGYGQFGTGKHFGTVKAHRIAYLLLIGEIPDGLTLDHLCRNRACVNPDHLEPVASGVNTLRGYSPAAQRARQATCRRGHILPPHRDGQQRRCQPCNTEAVRRFRKAVEHSDARARAVHRRGMEVAAPLPLPVVRGRVGGERAMTPLASWAFLALAIAPIVLCCWLLWPGRPPRPGASVASSAARRDGDTRQGGAR